MTIDEEKLSKIYQQGKGQGPSAQLDKSILEAAHAAVQQDKDTAQHVAAAAGKRTKVSGPFSGGWPAMASIAALLLITVILVPLIEQETPPEVMPEASDYMDDAVGNLEEKQIEVAPANKSKELPAVLRAKTRAQAERHLSKPPQTGAQLPGTPLSGSLQSGALNESAALQKKNFSRQQTVPGETTRLKQSTVGGFTSQLLKPAPSAVMQSEGDVSEQSAPGQKAMSDERGTELKADIDYQQGISVTADMAEESIKETEIVLQPDKWLQEIRDLIDRRNFIEAREELEQFKQYYPDEDIDAEISRSINEYFQDE